MSFPCSIIRENKYVLFVFSNTVNMYKNRITNNHYVVFVTNNRGRPFYEDF